MNDEYGRDSLTELIALLTLPSQQDNDYVMGRHSDSAAAHGVADSLLGPCR